MALFHSFELNTTVTADTESGPGILFILLFYFQNHVCHCLAKGILIQIIKIFLFNAFWEKKKSDRKNISDNCKLYFILERFKDKMLCNCITLHYIFVWVFITITQSQSLHVKTWATAGSQIRLKDSVSSYILFQAYYQNHLYHFDLHNIFHYTSSKLLFNMHSFK